MIKSKKKHANDIINKKKTNTNNFGAGHALMFHALFDGSSSYLDGRLDC